MIRWSGIAAFFVTAAIASAAVAEMPMSPVYRTGPEQKQPAAEEAAPAATDRAPADAANPNGEEASHPKPPAVEREPVATAVIPPPVSPGEDKTKAVAKAPSSATSSPAEKPPAEQPPAERKPAATAEQKPGPTAAVPSLPPAPAGNAAETAATPPDAPQSTAKPGLADVPENPQAATPTTPAEEVGEKPAGQEKKATTRAARRHDHKRRLVRRPAPAYGPPVYYGYPSAGYDGGARGYGGGAYGPSPYSSEGP